MAGGAPPRYNICPGQQVLTLGYDRSGQCVTRPAHWGFHPHWLPSSRRSPINARVEGAEQRPLFRRACHNGRCLVPADGWFEWQARASGPKLPYFFHLADDALFFFAGIAARGADGTPTLAILTRDADAESAAVHTRMPVALGNDTLASGWLEAGSAQEALALASTAEAPRLIIEPVSRRVNRPEHDDPACVRPLEQADGAAEE